MLKLVGLLLLVCQVELVVSQSCQDFRECNITECCFRSSGIVSRRDIDTETSAAVTSTEITTPTTPTPPTTPTRPPGVCQAYRRRGQDCSVFDSCGCAPGLRCEHKPPTTPSTTTDSTTTHSTTTDSTTTDITTTGSTTTDSTTTGQRTRPTRRTTTHRRTRPTRRRTTPRRTRPTRRLHARTTLPGTYTCVDA